MNRHGSEQFGLAGLLPALASAGPLFAFLPDDCSDTALVGAEHRRNDVLGFSGLKQLQHCLALRAASRHRLADRHDVEFHTSRVVFERGHGFHSLWLRATRKRLAMAVRVMVGRANASGAVSLACRSRANRPAGINILWPSPLTTQGIPISTEFPIPARGQAHTASLLKLGRGSASPAFSHSSARHGAGAAGTATTCSLARRCRFQFVGAA